MRAVLIHAAWPLALGIDAIAFVAMHADHRYSVYWAVSRVLAAALLQIAGLVLWWRRPGVRLGPLLLAVGLTAMMSHFVYLPSGPAVVMGTLAQPLPAMVVVHLLLVFPDGKFHAKREAVFVVIAYTLSLSGRLALLLVSPTRWLTGCQPAACPANPLLVHADSPLNYVFSDVANGMQIGLAVVFLPVLALRAARSGKYARRAYGPVLAVTAVLITTFTLRRATILAAGPLAPLISVADYAELVAVAALPAAIALGLLRAKPNVADLVTTLEDCVPARIPDVVGRFLDDPTLRVIVRSPSGGHADLAGRPVVVEPDNAPTTRVDTDTFLLHDARLSSDAALLTAVASAVRVTLQKIKLTEVAHQERRRIERDLHDGTQQRLIAMGMSIAHARAHLHDHEIAATALDEAATEVVATLAELRELSQGLRPAALVEHGLADALPLIVSRSPLPVRLHIDPNLQLCLSDIIETTAYFVVSEALQNAVKHSQASQISVVVAEYGGQLRLLVSDNGVGGADPFAGSGLRGLAERVASIAGTLHITSATGQGTVVMADIPHR